MRIDLITKYLVINTLKSIFTVFLIFSSIVLLANLVNDLNVVNSEGYTFKRSLIFNIMHTPNNILKFYPFILFLGCINILSHLKSNNEILAINMFGYSIVRIIKIMATVILLISLLITIFGELIINKIEFYAQSYKSYHLSNGKSFFSRDEVWVKYKNSYIRINNTLKHNKKIYKYDLDDSLELQKISSGYLNKIDNNNEVWHINNVKTSELTLNNVKNKEYNTQLWDIKLGEKYLYFLDKNIDNFSLVDLYVYIRSNDIIDEKHISFWQIISQPFMTMLLILFSSILVLGSNIKTGSGKNIIIGVILAIIMFFITKMIGFCSIAFQMSPMILTFFPIVIIWIIELTLIYRINKYSRI